MMGRLCSMKDCYEVTSDETGLCTSCKQNVFDCHAGVGRIEPKREVTCFDAVWALLPRTTYPGRKLTVFGLQTKQHVREMVDIIKGN